MSTLTPELTALVATATAVIDAATAPLHRICDATVSSALLTSTGRVFTGVNATHFTGGPCAEHVALGNANAAGVLNRPPKSKPKSGTVDGSVEDEGADGLAVETLIACVAVAHKGRGVINPCGKCRQILFDYHPHIKVIVRGDGGVVTVKGIRELLPWAYSWEKVVERA